MARDIHIAFDIGVDTHDKIHRIRNFGEDLYRMSREDGLMSVSLDDIDRATNELRIKVFSKRKVRRVASAVEALLKEHHLVEIARLSIVNPAS
jgi:hypothetical protein